MSYFKRILIDHNKTLLYHGILKFGWSKMKSLIALFFVLLMQSTYAAPELMFSGKPVDSLCFYNLPSNSKLIDLKTCGAKKENYTISGQNDDLIKKGYLGYIWKDPSSNSQGDSYYKVFSAGANKYWVYTLNNTGGSGMFSAIHQVQQKTPDTLEIKTLMSGDRCNGGVQDVVETNNQLRFGVNLTPADFLVLANKNPNKIQAYDDLSACAVCCTARAFYELDPSLNLKLSYIDLGEDADIENMPNQGKYQECFNKLLASSISKKETKLNPQKFNEFVEQFNKSCVVSGGQS